jgi:hypothetical protein
MLAVVFLRPFSAVRICDFRFTLQVWWLVRDAAHVKIARRSAAGASLRMKVDRSWCPTEHGLQAFIGVLMCQVKDPPVLLPHSFCVDSACLLQVR